MNAVAIIPARYASTRFPAKPLARETGKYLIQHVCERLSAARRISSVIVATDDERIRQAVASFGGAAVMTREDHPSGTDRVAEVVAGLDAELILNVQGDEPEIDPEHLDLLIQRMAEDNAAQIGTLCCPFGGQAQPRDPNKVKVVVSAAGRAIYFSRSLIPFPRDFDGVPDDPSKWLLHVGVYAYRRAALLRLASLPPSPLEQSERLEQLRALENGMAMTVVRVDHAAPGIDTPSDYAAFVSRCAGRHGGAHA
ncbi:MAG TPA: 3-deoxy-manno-octulosonate cytidylyltransferase [Phycisphaerae bacterium]|nr:3-deoxy-manno-octulosonate cytidylyltransferase [Phycisphaerae bacterium]HRW54616.1 3-deoxy-manno-octulosonate cytidylyltransferase [Phycisphaerae bacterium]